MSAATPEVHPEFTLHYPADFQDLGTDALVSAHEIAVDCEMDDKGKLSLVQLCTGLDVFVFDVLDITTGKAEKPELVAELKKIFEDPNKIKIFYDCRYDYYCLKKQLDISVESIRDCQIVAVKDREESGKLLDGEYFRKKLEEGKYSWNDLYCPSFSKTVEHYPLKVPREWKTLKKEVSQTQWGHRPLSEKQIQYAANDSRVLYLLWDKFKQGPNAEHLAELSKKYALLGFETGESYRDLSFKSNYIFPFTIFTNESARRCNMCECEVGISFFSKKKPHTCGKCTLWQKLQKRETKLAQWNDECERYEGHNNDSFS